MSDEHDPLVTEADAIAGVPLPRAQTRLIGHGHAEAEILDAYRSARMHHAWILAGPKGIGKATLAFRFARFALAHPDARSADVRAATSLAISDDHPDARKVAGGAHPGLLHLKRPYDPKRKGKDKIKQDLTVDEIRRTVPFFGSTGSEGSWRICIVDAADDMNANAANALLKILEEPPRNSLFLVIAHSPGRLLPTIRSRCRTLRLHELSERQVGEGLSMLGVAEAGSRIAERPPRCRREAFARQSDWRKAGRSTSRTVLRRLPRAFPSWMWRPLTIWPTPSPALARKMAGRCFRTLLPTICTRRCALVRPARLTALSAWPRYGKRPPTQRVRQTLSTSTGSRSC